MSTTAAIDPVGGIKIKLIQISEKRKGTLSWGHLETMNTYVKNCNFYFLIHPRAL